MLPTPAQWYDGLRLRILPLEVAIRWSRPARIPQHIIANVLRGAFNITFRRLVCPPEWMDNACPPCPLYGQCPYGQLFEPSPPQDSDRLRLVSDLPRPFVLKPPLPTMSADGETAGVSPRPRFGGEGAGVRGASAGDVATPQNGVIPVPPVATGPLDRLRVRSAGPPTPAAERLEFGLVLFGTAIDHLAHFIVTLAELGRVGMGPDRIPFAIESVTTPQAGGPEPLYDPRTHTFTPPRRQLTTQDIIARPPSPPLRGRGAGGEGVFSSVSAAGSDAGSDSDSGPQPSTLNLQPTVAAVARPSSLGARPTVTLRFLTPTLIRTGSGVDSAGRRIAAREVRERPEFGVLARRLRDRLSTLCAFFGESPWTGPDFAELGRLADTATLLHAETEWQHRSRYSTRSGESHEISGLTGQATYEFPSEGHKGLFLPLLRLAPHLHLGKHAVWGNGWVEVY